MNLSVSNCKCCGKVFQKRLSDLCPACIEAEDQKVRKLYRAIQGSASRGGIPIEELAHQVGMTADEIEAYYLEGRLGTASTLLKFSCQGCGVMIGELQRKGRFCISCSEKTASQAGVSVRSKQELEKREREEQKKMEQLALLKKHNSSRGSASPRRFGMTRQR